MAEILRPSFVRKAFHLIEPSRPSRLIVFIDDLDGLRKVPENVPHREDVEKYLGIPVSKIPDPFGCCASFADHMIGQLGGFLAPVEVEYELVRSAEMYSSGRFDEGLKLILEKHAGDHRDHRADAARRESRGMVAVHADLSEVRASRRASGDGLSP